MARKSSKARTARINELKTEYRKLAIQANRRMTNLEKLSENPEYEAVLGYAYKDVMHDLEALTGQKRFSHDIERLSAEETDIRHLVALINIATEFMESISSTKTGIDKVYKQRARTINKKFGTNFTPKDMRIFFESSIWDKLNDKLGSPVAMLVVRQIQEEPEKILKDIEESKQKHQTIDIKSLNIDKHDVNKSLTPEDKLVVEHLANIYANKK